MIDKALSTTYRGARRLGVALAGAIVLLLGLVMLILPGPGLLLIPLGLAILALEFAWARGWLQRLRRGLSEVGRKRRVATRRQA
jgi:tellurite resistance protein TerC